MRTRSRGLSLLVLVAAPNSVTESRLEAAALASVMPVEAIKPGAIRKPPPMPNSPAAKPAASPTGASFNIMRGERRTFGSPSLLRGSSIETAMAIIAAANQFNSICPSMILPSAAPPQAPANPAAANTLAHGHLTRPARACATRPASALTETAAAEVPMAI